jgi:nitrile hydratase
MGDGHHHPLPTTPVEDRVVALESLLTEKGIIDPAALDTVVEYYEHAVGPMNGAKVVARAWVGPMARPPLPRWASPVPRVTIWW